MSVKPEVFPWYGSFRRFLIGLMLQIWWPHPLFSTVGGISAVNTKIRSLAC